MLCSMAKSDFTVVIKVIDLKMGSLSWTTQVGLIYTHETLKAENVLYLKTGQM